MERLLQSLDYDHNRFLFLYGEGIQDCFISPDYREIAILESLWHILRSQKFECVLFYSHTERVFFFDSRSREHCLAPRGRGIPPPNGSREPEEMRLFRGPMGRRQLIPPPATAQPTESSSAQAANRPSRIGDSGALELMDWLMGDTSRRSAVVIWQAETSLRYFTGQGIQAGRMGAWTSLPLSNRNICILLFASNNLPQRIESHPEFIPIPELMTCFQSSQQRRSVLNVPGPEYTEALRMLDYTRLVRNKPIHWGERQRMAEMIARDGKLGRAWLQTLDQLPRLDIASLSPCLRSHRPGALLSWREELEHLEGLSVVKNHVTQLEAYLKDRREREQKGLISPSEQPPTLHLVFLGNPGTGKTTVARLVGEMYRDLGLLQKGHVVAVEYKDLIAPYVGQTVTRTDEQVDKALDGVLFIDEAYQLAESERGGFGQEAIDRLLTRMENERARLVVIVAGYTGPMQKFLQSNPGLSSRFPQDNRVVFPDYTPSELLNILRRFLTYKGLTCSDTFNRRIQELVENLFHERDEATFGNARVMRELAEGVEVMRATRRSRRGLPTDTPLEPEDISPAYQRYLLPPTPQIDELLAELNQLVGLDGIKETVTDLAYRLRANKRRVELGQQVPKIRLNMLFVGNPGTGKTTVARMLGKIFRAVGILRKGHVHEIRASDLIAGYVGQTATKAQEAMKEALDGVLFIDEAYQLTPGNSSDSFKNEATGALMQYIDQYPDRLVVIMAGYPREMAALMDSNPGLPRRFTQTMIFGDYSDEDLLEILRRKVAQTGVNLSLDIFPAARAYFQTVRQRSGSSFGNAGVVDILIGQMQGSQSRRMAQTDDDEILKTFEPEDVPRNILPEVPTQDAQHYLHYDLTTHLPQTSSGMTIEQVRGAVGLLQVKKDGGESTGTGFIVTPQGHLLTAYHVVEGARQVSFRLDGTETELAAEVVGLDEQADLAVLRLSPGPTYPWVPLAEAGYIPSIGQEIVVLGYPLGQQFGEEITLTDGVVSSLRSGGWMIQISAPVTHGSSGGPVFRKSDLRVLGAIHGGAKEAVGAAINFACNTQLVYLRFGARPAQA